MLLAEDAFIAIDKVEDLCDVVGLFICLATVHRRSRITESEKYATLIVLRVNSDKVKAVLPSVLSVCVIDLA